MRSIEQPARKIFTLYRPLAEETVLNSKAQSGGALMRILFFSLLVTGIFARLDAAAFQNGSFELGPTTPVNFCGVCNSPYIGTFGATYTGIPGWTVTLGSIDIIGLPGWAASNGSRSIDLDGLSAGTIAQTFDTLPGETYKVSFDLASNFYAGQSTKTLGVSAPGFSQTYTFDSTGRTALNMGWETNTLQFVAAGGSSTLSFTSLDVPFSAFGPALDNVQVNASATPEPATYLMLGLGLSSIVLSRRSLTQVKK